MSSGLFWDPGTKASPGEGATVPSGRALCPAVRALARRALCTRGRCIGSNFGKRGRFCVPPRGCRAASRGVCPGLRSAILRGSEARCSGTRTVPEALARIQRPRQPPCARARQWHLQGPAQTPRAPPPPHPPPQGLQEAFWKDPGSHTARQALGGWSRSRILIFKAWGTPTAVGRSGFLLSGTR